MDTEKFYCCSVWEQAPTTGSLSPKPFSGHAECDLTAVHTHSTLVPLVLIHVAFILNALKLEGKPRYGLITVCNWEPELLGIDFVIKDILKAVTCNSLVFHSVNIILFLIFTVKELIKLNSLLYNLGFPYKSYLPSSSVNTVTFCE